ncbi:MAG: LicD family protein [Bacteroidaceae bacterium]|nr:LicD family protein [Bacteroidaceae bacterium]
MNMNEEVRNGYTVTADMKKVWALEMKIAKKIFEVCDKYGLPIVSCGGTSIGALREKGFIPWDDDIDLEMLRKDYDKLVEVAPKEFTAPYFFQCAYTDKNYTHGHAQVRLDNTAAILAEDIFQDFHQGIFVDIFVLDTVPATKEGIEQLRRKTEPMKKALDRVSYASFHMVTFSPKWLFSVFKDVVRKRFSDLSKDFAKYEDCFRAVDDEGTEEVCSMAFTWAPFERHRRSKHLMEGITKVPFEDMMMPVPNGYHEILTRQFGDYMKPAKQPMMHSGFVVLDTERSYTEFLPELREERIRGRREKLLKALHLK